MALKPVLRDSLTVSSVLRMPDALLWRFLQSGQPCMKADFRLATGECHRENFVRRTTLRWTGQGTDLENGQQW